MGMIGLEHFQSEKKKQGVICMSVSFWLMYFNYNWDKLYILSYFRMCGVYYNAIPPGE